MKKVLLAIDESPASQKAATHVAALLRQQKELAVHVFHAIDPLPSALQESRGAEDPIEEEIVEDELKRKQASWRERAKAAAEPLIRNVVSMLEQAGGMPEN